MTRRDEMLALADELDGWRYACTQNSSGGDGQFRVECSSGSTAQSMGLRSVLRHAAETLRLSAQAGPGYVAGFEACREAAKETAFDRMYLPDNPSALDRAINGTAGDIGKAIAALPAPATASAGEEVTALDLARFIDDMFPAGLQYHCQRMAAGERLLSTYKITKRSAT